MVEKTVLKRKRSCTSHNLTIQNLIVKISSINYNLKQSTEAFPPQFIFFFFLCIPILKEKLTTKIQYVFFLFLIIYIL